MVHVTRPERGSPGPALPHEKRTPPRGLETSIWAGPSQSYSASSLANSGACSVSIEVLDPDPRLGGGGKLFDHHRSSRSGSRASGSATVSHQHRLLEAFSPITHAGQDFPKTIGTGPATATGTDLRRRDV